MGLVSDGGIHSRQNHLYKLSELATENNIDEFFIYAFTDRRDCDLKSDKTHIDKLE